MNWDTGLHIYTSSLSSQINFACNVIKNFNSVKLSVNIRNGGVARFRIELCPPRFNLIKNLNYLLPCSIKYNGWWYFVIHSDWIDSTW